MRKTTVNEWGWNEDPEGAKESANALKAGAKVLNEHLNGKSWLVGERMTLADIVVFNSLLSPFTFTFDAGFCSAMPHLCSWFGKMSKLPLILRTAGSVKIKSTGKSSAQALAGGSKEKGG